MEKIRDRELDTARGICVLSVLFIHTAFWSGESYVPRYFQSFSLLIDVPAFCLISGITSARFKKNIFHTLIKLVLLWVACSIIYEVVTLNFNISNVISILLIQNSYFPTLPVLSGSYWFVPVFCVTIIMFEIIRSYTKLFPIILVFIFLFFSYSYYSEYISKSVLLGIPIVYLLLFMYMFVIGYLYERFQKYITTKKLYYYLLFLISIMIILYYTHGDIVLNMQFNKFPVQLPYFVYSQISIVIMLLIIKYKFSTTIFEFLGKNALCFYIAQGISSSLIYYFVPYFKNVHWTCILGIMFFINFIFSLFLVISL